MLYFATSESLPYCEVEYWGELDLALSFLGFYPYESCKSNANLGVDANLFPFYLGLSSSMVRKRQELR